MQSYHFFILRFDPVFSMVQQSLLNFPTGALQLGHV